MSDAFILSACRTPIGKFRGSLSSLPATDLGAIAVREAVARAGFEPSEIDEVILGNVLSAGVGQAPARQAALRAGLPPTVAALTVNKVCGSGLKAVMLAAQGVRCGDVDLVVAGGMESMSQAGWVLPREAPALGDRVLIDSLMHDGLTCAFSKQSMGEIADDLATQAGISRDEQDRFALESHRRAIAAAEAGAFAEEIVPVPVRRGSDELVVSQDEGPRSDTNLERLARLTPSFRDGRHGHGRQFVDDQRRRRGGRRRFGIDGGAIGRAAARANRRGGHIRRRAARRVHRARRSHPRRPCQSRALAR